MKLRVANLWKNLKTRLKLKLLKFLLVVFYRISQLFERFFLKTSSKTESYVSKTKQVPSTPGPKMFLQSAFDLITEMPVDIDKITFQFSDTNQHLLINSGGVLIGMVEQKSAGGFSMHLRACLLPNMAARIALIFLNKNPIIVLGDCFEVTKKREWLFGKDALEYVAINNVELWMGKKPVSEKIQEVFEEELETDLIDEIFEAEKQAIKMGSKFLH